LVRWRLGAELFGRWLIEAGEMRAVIELHLQHVSLQPAAA
jgi:hypothetical protein